VPTEEEFAAERAYLDGLIARCDALLEAPI
jgi:hypothetical protein